MICVCVSYFIYYSFYYIKTTHKFYNLKDHETKRSISEEKIKKSYSDKDMVYVMLIG